MQTPSVARATPPLALFTPRVSPDPAWDQDTQPTNYRLKNGDTVALLVDTKGDFSTGYFVVPAGTEGTVVNARTPRVTTRPEVKSQYFANIDVVIEGHRGRIRVPHSAVKTVRKDSRKTPVH